MAMVLRMKNADGEMWIAERRTRTSELNAAQWNGLRTLPLFVRIFRIPVPQSAFRNPHFTCPDSRICWLCSENCKTRLYGFVWALNRQTVMIRIDYRLLAISPLLLAFGGFLLLRASAADPTAWIERSNTNAPPLLDFFGRFCPEYGTAPCFEDFCAQTQC